MGVTSYLFVLITYVSTCCCIGCSWYLLFGVEGLSACRKLEMYYVYAKIKWCFVIMYIYRYGYKADNLRGTYGPYTGFSLSHTCQCLNPVTYRLTHES